MNIVWTRRAARHLQAAYEYWARESSATAADKMLERVFSGVELLENQPEMGRPGRVPGTRELVLVPTPFLIAYRVRRDSVEIVAFLHGTRKWPGHF
ncbi:MAG: type II toxin-antitoxin system RelE/ParE family toxin [Candidatus Sulfotelmatobacter sp.]